MKNWLHDEKMKPPPKQRNVKKKRSRNGADQAIFAIEKTIVKPKAKASMQNVTQPKQDWWS